jgi:large subunit ribosomal protein L4
MIKAALRGVLSDRQRNERIHVISELSGELKTKAAIKAVRQFSDRARLLVVLAHGEDLHLIRQDQLNAYDVVVSDDVIFSKKALTDFVAGPAKGTSTKAVGRESELGVSA